MALARTPAFPPAAALTQQQMEALLRLDDVRGVLRAHVQKVDQMRIFRFLQQASKGDVEALRAMLNQVGARGIEMMRTLAGLPL